MTPEDPKSRTARSVRSAGHKASGGHSLHTQKNRIERDPNTPPHARGRHMTAFQPYPQWLHFDGEPSVLVQDDAEHEAVMAARTPEPEKRGPGRPKKVAESVAAEPEAAPEPEAEPEPAREPEADEPNPPPPE